MGKLGKNELDNLIDVILSDDKLFNYVMKLIHQNSSNPCKSSVEIIDKIILKAFEDVRIGDMVKNIMKEHESIDVQIPPETLRKQPIQSPTAANSKSRTSDIINTDARYIEIQKEVERQKLLRRQKELQLLLKQQEDEASKTNSSDSQQKRSTIGSTINTAPNYLNGDSKQEAFMHIDSPTEPSINSEFYDNDNDMKPNYSFSEPEQVTYTDSRRKVKQLNKQRKVGLELAIQRSNQVERNHDAHNQVISPGPLIKNTLSIDVDGICDDEEFSLGESEKNNNSFLSEPVTLSEASTVRMIVTPVSSSLGIGAITNLADTDSMSSQEVESVSKCSNTDDEVHNNAISSQSSGSKVGSNDKPNQIDQLTNTKQLDCDGEVEPDPSYHPDESENHDIEDWERKVMQRMREGEDAGVSLPWVQLGHQQNDVESLRQSDSDMVRMEDISPPVVYNKSNPQTSINQIKLESTEESHLYEDDYEKEEPSVYVDVNNDDVSIFRPVIASSDPHSNQIDTDEFKYLKDLEDPNSPNPRPGKPLYFDQGQFDSEVDCIIAGKPLRHVKFSSNVVSEVFFREKTSPSEKTTLFYTHEEEGNFCAAQSREYSKADALGLTWMEYMNQRNDDDANLEDDNCEQEDYQDDYEMENCDEEFEHDYHHYYHQDDDGHGKNRIQFSDDMDDSEEVF